MSGDDLLFGEISYSAEIYKIHGPASRPDTMVLDQADYTTDGDRVIIGFNAVGDGFGKIPTAEDLYYGTDTVWPDERGTLAVRPGRDLCTLVTCTPLGVNDHRLFVHGERVDYDSKGSEPRVDGSPHPSRDLPS